MIVNYDLSMQLVSFDFYGWLIEQVHCGASEVVFATGKYRPAKRVHPDEILRRRFESIIAPGPALMGLRSREGEDGERVGIGYKFPHWIRFAREHKMFRRLRSVLPPGSARYTVTIRQSEVDLWRNSNRVAWLRFADEIGAYVIEDYDVSPMHLHQRMALYAGAEMNFGISGGPMWMCSLSEYPCMIFGLNKHRTYFERCGMQHGETMPWCKGDQFTFWDADDIGFINTRFKEWRRQRP
jgi:hypothetical protein